MTRSVLHRATLAAVCAGALLAACSGADSPADSAKIADSLAAIVPPPSPAPPALTDGNIFAKLDAGHMHDSTAGALAVEKGTDAGVKAFGRMMTTEHHAMHVEGKDLAGKLGVTPELPPGDPDVASMKNAEDGLTAMPRGGEWDRAYIDHNAAGREKVLRFAQTASNTTQNAELKAMLEKAAPIIQKHLEQAKALQARLP